MIWPGSVFFFSTSFLLCKRTSDLIPFLSRATLIFVLSGNLDFAEISSLVIINMSKSLANRASPLALDPKSITSASEINSLTVDLISFNISFVFPKILSI